MMTITTRTRCKFNAFWFYAQPTGTFSGTGGNGIFRFSERCVVPVLLNVFTGGVDWKFTRKNHLLFTATPFDHSKSFVASRTIIFQGQTFDAGLSAIANLKVNAYAPGYQYDIIRRKRGHLGIQSAARSLRCAGKPRCRSSSYKRVPRASQKRKGIVASSAAGRWTRRPLLLADHTPTASL